MCKRARSPQNGEVPGDAALRDLRAPDGEAPSTRQRPEEILAQTLSAPARPTPSASAPLPLPLPSASTATSHSPQTEAPDPTTAPVTGPVPSNVAASDRPTPTTVLPRNPTTTVPCQGLIGQTLHQSQV